MSDEAPIDYSTGGPRLVGGRCGDCDEVMFPRRDRCPRCAASTVTPCLLPSRGTLWTWTVQGFPPPSPPYMAVDPEDFVPFGVGYVELPGALRVESRLVGDPREFAIGMEVELVTIELAGDELFAFAPVRR
jgi:uncharacterized protein